VFNYFRKRKIERAEESVNKMVFVTRVKEMRQRGGFPDVDLPLENLVAIFAMNVADMVFRVAKNSATPEIHADPVEKAATLVVFLQSVHMSSRMAGITDKETKSIIIQNGMARLLQTDLDRPTPQAQAEMALAVNAYQVLSSERLAILTRIDELAHANLVSETDEILKSLVVCWRQVVAYLAGYEAA
jgi:hypothetical protein